MSNDLFEAQLEQDIRQRITQLEDTLYSARKARVDENEPANAYCGGFTGLLDNIRYFDVPDYVAYLKERFGM